MEILERWLNRSRYLTYLTVIVGLFSCVVLYLSSLATLGEILYSALIDELSTDSPRAIAVGLLKVWDQLLIAATFQLMAIGIYQLFLKPEAQVAGPKEIRSISDLKNTLLSMSIIVLVVLFLEHAVKRGGSRELLELGFAIAPIILAAGWIMSRK